SERALTATARRSSSSSRTRPSEPADREAARDARGAAARHEPDEPPLPRWVQELERGAARRARPAAALHGLPLRERRARRPRRRVRGDEARPARRSRAPADRSYRLRVGIRDIRGLREAPEGRARPRPAARP